MPRKVYIVETGEYSDRSIEGVFSTEKLAFKHCGEYANIQEWIVDEQLQMKMRTVFVCTLDTETGNLIEDHAQQANCSPWSSHSDAWREKAT